MSEWDPKHESSGADVSIPLPEDRPSLRLSADGMEFLAREDWYWDFHLREEASRGLDARSDLFAPGAFHARLEAGDSRALAFSSETGFIEAWQKTLTSARARQAELLERAGAHAAHPVVQDLILAADQFIVRRSVPESILHRQPASARESGRTIIAGYPWFNDWGRDAMFALPGLTLATGRHADAAAILRTFAAYEHDGLFPDNLPDKAKDAPGCNTVDAALWFIIALRAYGAATGDNDLVLELLPTVRRIVDAYAAGTQFGIGVDSQDGLLRAGTAETQLTWMDAKVGDWVVTPRSGNESCRRRDRGRRPLL